MQSLRESIELLYVAFADVPKPRRIEGCPHCLDEKEGERLLASSLRDVRADDLAAYASSAFLTVGDVADYLYFLPRILEISATDESWFPDPEISGRCIRTAKPEDWPAPRVTALLGFNAAVVHDAITSGACHKLDTWLCAIDRMGLDVRPHLRQISSSTSAILAYFNDNVRCLPQNRLCNAFWELPSDGHDAIVEWFYSDEIRKVPFEANGYRLEPSS